jgi:hypothetical protein
VLDAKPGSQKGVFQQNRRKAAILGDRMCDLEALGIRMLLNECITSTVAAL